MRLFRREEVGASVDLLVAGLGNPGREHAHDRHNVGWMVVDELARRHGGSFKGKFRGRLADVRVGEAKLALLKPETYMNESGASIQAAGAFYKLPPGQVLVVHDDVDLETSRLQARLGGGLAGHNGLRSIAQRLGSQEFLRLRIGEDRLRTALSVQPDAPGAAQGTFLLTVVPPIGQSPARPRDVVFVLDRSGSMGGWKMVAARRADGGLETLLPTAVDEQPLARRVHEVPFVELPAVEQTEILEQLEHEAERSSGNRHVVRAPRKCAHLVAAPACVASGFGLHFEELEIAEAPLVEAPGRR